MAIKASGFRLTQVTETTGFAVVETSTLRDVTAEQGYPPLRPSVETGFHALLGTFVLHTHPVYANLALCSVEGDEVIRDVMDGIPHITVPYINPGEALSKAIGGLLKPDTSVVFMQNHGVAVTADTAEQCLQLHDEVNRRIAAYYNVTPEDFAGWLAYSSKPLYPDQQVYLTLTEAQNEIMAAVSFIHSVLARKGHHPRAMDESAMAFIAGWESEAYRKTIVQ